MWWANPQELSLSVSQRQASCFPQYRCWSLYPPHSNTEGTAVTVCCENHMRDRQQDTLNSGSNRDSSLERPRKPGQASKTKRLSSQTNH